MKKTVILLMSLILVTGVFSGCNNLSEKSEQSHSGVNIELSDNGITVDGNAASTDSTQAVYTANDIIYYESGHDFTYGEGSEKDAHSKEEADAHTVVHITKSGNYVLSGNLSKGQIAVDLGEGAEENPDAAVTLVLNNVDINCDVAPAVIFYNVYECGSKNTETAEADVDTSAAGANVIIADNSENNITGDYVEKIYKPETVVLNDDGTEVKDAKKLHKYDGAFYSKMSMNINGGDLGNGILNITASNEGLNSELHLTLNGGNINIFSGNDGINTNEDNISVTTINSGNLNIVATGETGEGDGIDSNGWLVINGGSIFSQGCAISGDAGIDSDMGIHINAGKVFASGNMLDRISESKQNFAVFTFESSQKGGNYKLKNAENKIIAEKEIKNSFTYLIISDESLAEGDYTLWKDEIQLQGGSSQNGGRNHGNMAPPEGFEMPEGMTPPEKPEDMSAPEGMIPPEKPQNNDFIPPEMPENMSGPNHKPDHKSEEITADLSTIFKIKNGANYFVSVKSV